MVKIAASAAIRAHIPTRPRVGRHSTSRWESVKDVVLIALAPLLVFPVRIIRMLKIPERTATLDRRNGVEVVGGRRRIRGPFKCPGVPWITSSRLAPEIRPEQVSQEDQNPGSLEKNSNGHDKVPGFPTPSRFIGVNPSRHAQQTRDV